jgi:hypothetical protein
MNTTELLKAAIEEFSEAIKKEFSWVRRESADNGIEFEIIEIEG